MRKLVQMTAVLLACSCSSGQDASEETNVGGIELVYVFADTVLGEMSWGNALFACDTFSANGYHDWYLPDLHSISQAYNLNRNPSFPEYNGRIPESFFGYIYWTSTEDWSKIVCFDFVRGKENSVPSEGNYQVWPIRKNFELQQGNKVLSIERYIDTLSPIVDNPGVFYSPNNDLGVKIERNYGGEIGKYLRGGYRFVTRQIIRTELGSYIQGKFYAKQDVYNPHIPIHTILSRTEFDYFFISPHEWQ